jgi:hypothetical protein
MLFFVNSIKLIYTFFLHNNLNYDILKLITVIILDITGDLNGICRILRIHATFIAFYLFSKWQDFFINILVIARIIECMIGYIKPTARANPGTSFRTTKGWSSTACACFFIHYITSFHQNVSLSFLMNMFR